MYLVYSVFEDSLLSVNLHQGSRDVFRCTSQSFNSSELLIVIGFHGDNTGSNPVGDANEIKYPDSQSAGEP